jgi:predicted secreted protein
VLRTVILRAVISLAFVTRSSFADDAQARWDQIRSSLFGEWAVQDGRDVIGLKPPLPRDGRGGRCGRRLREARSDAVRFIKTGYLVIDMNPLPLAAVIRFPGANRWESLSRVSGVTRTRPSERSQRRTEGTSSR